MNDGDRETIDVSFVLPSDISAGDYDVKFTIRNDDISLVRYKIITVGGDNFVSGNEKIEVSMQPNLVSYQPTENKSRINWLGIWFMILLLLALLALVIYLTKKALEDNKQVEPTFDWNEQV